MIGEYHLWRPDGAAETDPALFGVRGKLLDGVKIASYSRQTKKPVPLAIKTVSLQLKLEELDKPSKEQKGIIDHMERKIERGAKRKIADPDPDPDKKAFKQKAFCCAIKQKAFAKTLDASLSWKQTVVTDGIAYQNLYLKPTFQFVNALPKEPNNPKKNAITIRFMPELDTSLRNKGMQNPDCGAFGTGLEVDLELGK